MTGFLLRAVITAIGLWLATVWVHGVRIDDARHCCWRGCCSAW
jgi:uncharacterized membrane protein YvlD (DUF360 family)